MDSAPVGSPRQTACMTSSTPTIPMRARQIRCIHITKLLPSYFGNVALGIVVDMFDMKSASVTTTLGSHLSCRDRIVVVRIDAPPPQGKVWHHRHSDSFGRATRVSRPTYSSFEFAAKLQWSHQQTCRLWQCHPLTGQSNRPAQSLRPNRSHPPRTQTSQSSPAAAGGNPPSGTRTRARFDQEDRRAKKDRRSQYSKGSRRQDTIADRLQGKDRRGN